MPASFAQTVTVDKLLTAYDARIARSRAEPRGRRPDGVSKNDFELQIQQGLATELVELIRRGSLSSLPPTELRPQRKKDGEGWRDIEVSCLWVATVAAGLLDHLLDIWSPPQSMFAFPSLIGPGGPDDAWETLTAAPEAEWFVRQDIKNAFPSVGHDVARESLRSHFLVDDVELVMAILSAPVSRGGEVRERKVGIPQGIALSQYVLAVVLADLSKELDSLAASHVIYVDDIAAPARTRAGAERINDTINRYLDSRGMAAKHSVSDAIVPPGRDFEFLGLAFEEWMEGSDA